MYELELLLPDNNGPRLRVGGRVVFIGRGSQCDLVLQDEVISTRHLAIWSGDGRLFIEDLRSRNGTRINQQPLQGRAELAVGDLIELGTSTRLCVRRITTDLHPTPAEYPLIEDVASGACFPARKERFVFGSDGDADVVVPGATGVVAVLLLHATGEVWLGADAEDRQLQENETFQVLDRSFRLRMPAREWGLTRELVNIAYPYELRVTLDGPSGPVAVFSHRDGRMTLELHAETRTVLMYVLARKLRDDILAGVPIIERGWLNEIEVAQGVWGRAGVHNIGAALNVLVWRVRKELEARGFDPWCIEKRQKYLRLRVEHVEIVDQKGAPGTP